MRDHPNVWGSTRHRVDTQLLLSVSAIHDRVSHGRIHPVSLWVPVLVFAWMNLLPFVVLPSTTWREFAAWLIR